ncbi:hypothetical protein ZIOFF_002820 [Zingiber officinale]|uniref:Uncharacterized protein n=1 Tax=Zingiber officinale TaxID=94328 RepID=A0A8J5IMD8_ZINOF|nr:hypothetical protein ZIOFF_002820 [Zingiber officinale]
MNPPKVRREKIGERMKLLPNLVPGCSKFLSMKLSTLNSPLLFDMETLLLKDVISFTLFAKSYQ